MTKQRFGSTCITVLTAALAAVGCGRAPTELAALTTESQAGIPPTAAVANSKSSSAASALPAFTDDYAAAIAHSQAEGRPLLLFFQADWCLHCRRMTDTVFTESRVRSLAEKFVCVRIDGSRHPELCEEFNVRAFPTLVFASPSGTALQRLVGAQTPQAVAQEMTTALTAVAERQTQPATIRR